MSRKKRSDPVFAEMLLKAAVLRLVLAGRSADDVATLARRFAEKAERLQKTVDAAATRAQQG